LVGTRLDRHRAVHGHHGHLDHRRGPAADAGRPRVHPAQPVVGVQRLRHRPRRPTPARRQVVRPVRRPPDVRDRLARPARRLTRRRARHQRRHRTDRPRHPGRRLRIDRPLCADIADDDLRSEPEGTHQGSRALRRSRPRRWHRRCVPGRRDHRVHLVALESSSSTSPSPPSLSSPPRP